MLLPLCDYAELEDSESEPKRRNIPLCNHRLEVYVFCFVKWLFLKNFCNLYVALEAYED